MRGKLESLTFTSDGEQLLTIRTSEDVRKLYGELKDTDIKFDIKKYHKPRSLDANALCWVLIDKLAERIGEPPQSVYCEMIRDIPGVSDILCVREKGKQSLMDGWRKNGIGWQCEEMESKLKGCVNVKVYYGSSTYDSKQMSVLIDRVISECKEYGVDTTNPEELRRLEEYSFGYKKSGSGKGFD